VPSEIERWWRAFCNEAKSGVESQRRTSCELERHKEKSRRTCSALSSKPNPSRSGLASVDSSAKLTFLSLDPPPAHPPKTDDADDAEAIGPCESGDEKADPGRPTACDSSGEKCSGPNEAARSCDDGRPRGACDAELVSDDERESAGRPCGWT